MPSRFIVRTLRGNCVYHIYNKSVQDQELFRDAQDYRVFLFYLYIYTSPIEQVIKRYSDLPSRLRNKTLAGKLEVIAYCLLPDHFHLVIKQSQADAMPQLMKQIANGYTVYFNQKYKRMGPVTQGRYKAVEVAEEQIPDLVRHIHLNPVLSGTSTNPADYQWSSYKKYLGGDDTIILDTSILTNTLDTQKKLIDFHTNKTAYDQSLPNLTRIAID